MTVAAAAVAAKSKRRRTCDARVTNMAHLGGAVFLDQRDV
jgi:hypothetical protein